MTQTVRHGMEMEITIEITNMPQGAKSASYVKYANENRERALSARAPGKLEHIHQDGATIITVRSFPGRSVIGSSLTRDGAESIIARNPGTYAKRRSYSFVACDGTEPRTWVEERQVDYLVCADCTYLVCDAYGEPIGPQRADAQLAGVETALYRLEDAKIAARRIATHGRL